MKEAMFVKDVSAKFNGEAQLFSVKPEQETEDGVKYNFIVASATVVPLSGPETYLFPADQDGNILDWGELEGSYRGGLNCAAAIENWGNC